jgi:alpha-D-xyloside xylohydrolase
VTPWCFYSGSASGYALSSYKATSYGYTGVLSLISNTNKAYGDDISSLKLDVIYESESVFHLHITDTSSSRYEIPQSVISRPTMDKIKHPMEVLYDFEYTSSPFTFKVIRKSDSKVIFQNSNPIVFKDQFIELSTSFESDSKTYGIGESTRLNHALETGQYTLWNADNAAIVENVNLYGSFPYYLQMNDGQASGAMLMNSNGMDVQLRDDSLTFTTIGGIIDLYVFVGPSAEEVVQQYTSIVGRPAMMPYWSLGFHNCKYGYTSLAQVEAVVANYSAAKIPLDTQWMDIDYMQNYRDFTVDSSNFIASDVKNFVAGLHANGQHFVPIIDPGIMVYSGYDAYESGLKKDLFVKDITGNYYLGQVWPGPTYFPDFLHPSTASYWQDELESFYEMVGMDGIWIDMNEVSNFCNVDGTGQTCANSDPKGCPAPGASQTECCLVCQQVDASNRFDYPPYAINNRQSNGKLSAKTMAVSATHYSNISDYNVHNLYGLTEQIATHEAMANIRNKRPFVLTRSSFLSSGKWTAKWTGDNGATWDDLKSSIISLMDFNMFGIPMIGADICGFIDDTTEELCARWIEVGAFYPFSRDHNTLGAAPQELYLWDSVTIAAQTALSMKYQLLPYYYTLLYQAHTTGSTVVRPLWTSYPADSSALEVERQFLVGSGVLVTPVLDQGVTSVTGYFPRGNWYNFKTRSIDYHHIEVGSYHTISTPLTSTNVHVSGGTILPLQGAAMTTTAARLTPFTFLVGLCLHGGAEGSLYYDDGEQIELSSYFSASYETMTNAVGGTFTGLIEHDSYTAAKDMTIDSIVVMGSSDSNLAPPSIATLNDVALSASQYNYDSGSYVLTFSNLKISLNSKLVLAWEY